MRGRAVACVIALASACVGACGQSLAAAPDDLPDASTTVDATAADAATCSTSISDNFDRTDLTKGGWTLEIDRGEIASIALDNGNARAFSSSTFGSGGLLDSRQATLARDLPAVPKSLKCSFKMRIDTEPNAGYVDAFSVLLTGSDGNVSRIRLSVQHTTLGLREDQFLPNGDCAACPKGPLFTSTAALNTLQWYTVTFTTDDYKKYVATAGDYTVSFTPLEPLTPTKVSLVLGTINFTDGEGASQSFDDFVCELGC